MDYEDMIMFVLSMLKSNESLRNEAHKKFKYILVDEYQDTSENNFELLKMLLPQKNYNLFTVGDDWQSIYGFRSAKVEYIINMKKFFPGVKIHKLKVNYRSNKEIVKLSNKFIKNNRSRTRKILKSHKGKGGRVMFYKASGIEQEAEIIQRIILSEKNKTKDIAILFRNNWQGKFIESKFFGNGEISNGLNFLTMHASKGLEFDTVIITGISDKIIPDRSSNIEEERRLMYVALTRAKERLHLIHHLNDEKERSVFCKELGIPID